VWRPIYIQNIPECELGYVIVDDPKNAQREVSIQIVAIDPYGNDLWELPSSYRDILAFKSRRSEHRHKMPAG